MISNQSQLDPASSGRDFQPTTQSPQPTDITSLQTPATNVQPVIQSGTTSTSAQQLFEQADRQQNLTVQTDGHSLDSRVSVPASSPHSNSGLITITGTLFLLLIMVVIIKRYWKQPAQTEAGLDTTDGQPIPHEAPSSVVVPPSAPHKPRTKKAKKKKRSKH
ncbi:MAG: hypothetical protein NVS1B7_1190 [Candidatus Saccharimonadales bacterium]